LSSLAPSAKTGSVARSASTLLVHPDYQPHSSASAHERTGRAIAPGIERSSTYTLDGPGAAALISGEHLREHDVYGRFGTATTRATAALIAALERGEAALLTSSGMAAITTVLTAMIPAGGRFACADLVYGGTETAIRQTLAARNVATTRFDARSSGQLAALLDGPNKPDLVWCESIANPLMQVAPIRELAELCRAAGVLLGVDATFAGGMAHHPLELGASIVVHSASKYLNGHSDVIAGAIVSDATTIDRCFATLSHTGCCIDPQAAWLLQRGLRTLPLRWAQHCISAGILAQQLREHPAVRAVHYPGLDAEAMARGSLRSAGGMLAFELADLPAAERLLARVRLCTHAPSLGGLETLICSPLTTSHTQLDPATRRARGIADGLVRLSVGIEHPDDLWDDLQFGLS
jgi:cystathionine beta-lyase/cystathionine gamma-synthase